jgi:hypothetical protein
VDQNEREPLTTRGRESASRMQRCASRQRRKNECWRAVHSASEPSTWMCGPFKWRANWGGAWIWNVSTSGHGTGGGMWALSVPNVKPVVLSPKTRVQPFVMPYNYNVCLGTRKSFIDSECNH